MISPNNPYEPHRAALPLPQASGLRPLALQGFARQISNQLRRRQIVSWLLATDAADAAELAALHAVPKRIDNASLLEGEDGVAAAILDMWCARPPSTPPCGSMTRCSLGVVTSLPTILMPHPVPAAGHVLAPISSSARVAQCIQTTSSDSASPPARSWTTCSLSSTHQEQGSPNRAVPTHRRRPRPHR